MSGKVATNIRLPEDLLKILKYKAIEKKKSVNQLILEAIERDLEMEGVLQDSAPDSFDKVIGIAHSGVGDGSLRHDDYLYGNEK